MLIKVKSVAFKGIQTVGIDVEINIANRGLPTFDIVGLPSKAVAESKERVRTAIRNSGFTFPTKKIIVNLAPADITKEGSFYDLPIATGLLSYICNFKVPENSLFFGEVSLDGSLRHTRGALLVAIHANETRLKAIFVPASCLEETALSRDITVFGVNNLLEISQHLKELISISTNYKATRQHKLESLVPHTGFAEISGQMLAKRSLEIASAGGHNVLLIGPPGIGKSMLVNAMVTILPPLSVEESIDVTKIYSYVGLIGPNQGLISQRPLRAPHHTISYIGLIGGGTRIKPGEISLAHRGVLFLDEFSEFPRNVVESLRQPMEKGFIAISRGAGSVTFPAKFTLVAASNPCPCGFSGHPTKSCVCTDRQKENYKKKISGPMLDRIDIVINVEPVEVSELEKKAQKGEPPERIRGRVVAARKIQAARFRSAGIITNSEMDLTRIRKYCGLKEDSKFILSRAADKLGFSARKYFKVLKVARTIADLDNSNEILKPHIAEAIQLSSL